MPILRLLLFHEVIHLFTQLLRETNENIFVTSNIPDFVVHIDISTTTHTLTRESRLMRDLRNFIFVSLAFSSFYIFLIHILITKKKSVCLTCKLTMCLLSRFTQKIVNYQCETGKKKKKKEMMN